MTPKSTLLRGLLRGALLNEMLALPDHNGWRFSLEYPGVFCFSHPETRLVVYCTPDYHVEGVLPIEVFDSAKGLHHPTYDKDVPLPTKDRTVAEIASQIFEMVRPTLDDISLTLAQNAPDATPPQDADEQQDLAMLGISDDVARREPVRIPVVQVTRVAVVSKSSTTWDLVVQDLEALERAEYGDDVIDEPVSVRVIADVRARHAAAAPHRERPSESVTRDHLGDAYDAQLDLVFHLRAWIESHPRTEADTTAQRSIRYTIGNQYKGVLRDLWMLRHAIARERRDIEGVS